MIAELAARLIGAIPVVMSPWVPRDSVALVSDTMVVGADVHARMMRRLKRKRPRRRRRTFTPRALRGSGTWAITRDLLRVFGRRR